MSRSGKTYTTYRCSRRANTKQCDCIEIKGTMLEGWVLDEFCKYFFSDNSISKITSALNERLKEQCENNDNYKYAKEALNNCLKKRENLLNAIELTGANAEIAQRLKSCDEQIKEHQATVDSFENMFRKSEITEGDIKEKLTQLREYIENPDNFNEVRYVLSQYIQRIDVSNDGVSVTFKAALAQKGNTVTLDESIYTSRKDLKKDYKFIEKHHELSSKLDKLYNLSKKE